MLKKATQKLKISIGMDMLLLQIDCKVISCIVTATFIIAFCEPIAHAKKACVYIPVVCIALIQQPAFG